ncbi:MULTISPECIES: hypothetical protein [unclassified Eikenella]|uniref:hypothetical protein n=1 Tax=unclassified Eikenella TaxID=2639367 RepID=UPI0012E80D09|nr:MULTISPECIES: hypothetical protein [unclassified Eikenella]
MGIGVEGAVVVLAVADIGVAVDGDGTILATALVFSAAVGVVGVAVFAHFGFAY